MKRVTTPLPETSGAGAADQPPDLRRQLHRLNNQLGIVLAQAELMERRATDDATRARAAQVVGSVLDAMGTAKEIRLHVGGRSPNDL